MKSSNLQPRLLCPAKILFRIEGEIKKFLETKSSSSPNHYYMKYLRELFNKMMKNRMAKKKKTPIQFYQQLNLKNKLSKQKEERQVHGYSEHFGGCQMGEGCRGMGEEVRGLRSTNR